LYIKQRGYTLIEIIVVAAIIALALGSWLFVSMSSQKMGKKQELSQEYYRLVIKLQSTLKRDLRSALTVIKRDNGNCLIEVIRSLSETGPEVTTVIYKKESGGKIISRLEEDKREIYDFTQFPDCEKFSFELILPLDLLVRVSM